MSQWIEPLERRQHLNGDVLSAARTTDAIVIHGTSASETFVVRPAVEGNRVVVTYKPSPEAPERTLYRSSLKGLKSIQIDGGAGLDELRVDAILTSSTRTRHVETRRVFHPRTGRLTGEYSVAALPGNRRGRIEDWVAKHRGQMQALTPADRQTDVLVLGDSMAEWFLTAGHTWWDRRMRPLGAVNLGLTGDTTGNLLWRLNDGLLDGFDPKVVVLAIGANNIGRTDNVTSTIRGIREVIRAIHARLPNTTIVLSTVFPRREAVEGATVRAVNARLLPWDDGGQLRVLDVTPNFAPNDVVREDLFRPADVHLNDKGYRLWSNLLTPVIDELLA
jgi:hypothetical protein